MIKVRPIPLAHFFYDSSYQEEGQIHQDSRFLLIQRKQFKVNRVRFESKSRSYFDYIIKFTQITGVKIEKDGWIRFQLVSSQILAMQVADPPLFFKEGKKIFIKKLKQILQEKKAKFRIFDSGKFESIEEEQKKKVTIHHTPTKEQFKEEEQDEHQNSTTKIEIYKKWKHQRREREIPKVWLFVRKAQVASPIKQQKNPFYEW